MTPLKEIVNIFVKKLLNKYEEYEETIMRMQHIVKFQSGDKVAYKFQTKSESDKALENAILLNKSFGTIKCVWIEPINQPWKRERIDF